MLMLLLRLWPLAGTHAVWVHGRVVHGHAAGRGKHRHWRCESCRQAVGPRQTGRRCKRRWWRRDALPSHGYHYDKSRAKQQTPANCCGGIGMAPGSPGTAGTAGAATKAPCVPVLAMPAPRDRPHITRRVWPLMPRWLVALW